MSSDDKIYSVDVMENIPYNSVEIFYRLVGNLGATAIDMDSGTQEIPVSHSWNIQNEAQITMGWQVPGNVLIGSTFIAILTVTNTGGSTASNVSCDSFNISTASIFVTNATPSPASMDILPNASAQFVWQFTPLSGTSGLSAFSVGESARTGAFI